MSIIVNGFALTFFCNRCTIKLTSIERMMTMTLGECINRYLNEHDMSMRAFAAKAGVSHAYVSYIVNNKSSIGKVPAPTITKYRAFAEAMSMSVDDLIAMVDDRIQLGASTPISLSEEESVLILAWRSATLEDRQTAAFALRKYGMAVPSE